MTNHVYPLFCGSSPRCGQAVLTNPLGYDSHLGWPLSFLTGERDRSQNTLIGCIALIICFGDDNVHTPVVRALGEYSPHKLLQHVMYSWQLHRTMPSQSSAALLVSGLFAVTNIYSRHNLTTPALLDIMPAFLCDYGSDCNTETQSAGNTCSYMLEDGRRYIEETTPTA